MQIFSRVNHIEKVLLTYPRTQVHAISVAIRVTSWERHGLSNHRQLGCLINSFNRNSALLILLGNPSKTGEFPSKRTTNMECIWMMSWRFHGDDVCRGWLSYGHCMPLTFRIFRYVIDSKINVFVFVCFCFFTVRKYQCLCSRSQQIRNLHLTSDTISSKRWTLGLFMRESSRRGKTPNAADGI